MNTLVVTVLLPVFIYSQPTVFTKLGNIIGQETEKIDGIPVYTFLGIPYAQPPIGTLRFQEPQPLTEKFKTPYKAIKTFRCLQYLATHKVITGSEDCLYLNVVTTSLSKYSNHDVLVFIHGGGFVHGAGHSYTPNYLYEVSKELVYVSINYRLGPFGFLSTEDSLVPGNNGLKDQVLALTWVQDNIRLFGGNPDRVIVAGMSAGSVSVHFHYLSPMSKHLFSHGISMSGSALSTLLHAKNARKNTEYLAEHVNCPTDNTTIMVNCLKSIQGKTLLNVLYEKKLPWDRYNSFIHFGPVVEKSGKKPFLSQHPYHLLRRGKVKHAPWLVSTTTAEGLKPAACFITQEEMLQELNEHWDTIAPHLLVFPDALPEDKQAEISRQIRKTYFGTKPINQETRNELIKLIGDRLYMTNIENAIRIHAQVSKAPVYFYMFDYRGKYSFSQIISKSNMDLGVSHVDDLIYLLKMEKIDPKVEDNTMIIQMTNIWMAFIKRKVPETNITPKWPPVSRSNFPYGKLTYIKITGPSEITRVSSYDISQRDFWDNLPLDELHIAGDHKIPPHILNQQDLLGRLVTWVACYITMTLKKEFCKDLCILCW